MKLEEPITCEGCVEGLEMCETRPCWGTPEDIRRIISAGFANRLMVDWWSGTLDGFDSPDIIGPAIAGKEAGYAGARPDGRCTFLTSDGKCELHALGLKPSEGAIACCKRAHLGGGGKHSLHRQIAKTWATQEGQALAAEWREHFEV